MMNVISPQNVSLNFKNIREDVIERLFERQVFARPKTGVDERVAIKKKKGKISYNFDNCTFDEESYTGVFFAITHDERLEIRLKAIDSLKYFSSKYPSVQDKAQEILMNMLNDEVDEVRIASLKWLSVFDRTLILDQDDVDVVIFNLKEYNSELRHSIYLFFGHIKVDKWSTWSLLIEHLFINMKIFKMDKYGIFKTFRRLGSNHDELVYENLDKILNHDSKFKAAEPQWDNDEHTAKMIMIWSSIHKNKKILDKVPWYFDQQWSYYNDKYPDLVSKINDIDKPTNLYSKIFKSNMTTESGLIYKFRVHKIVNFSKNYYSSFYQIFKNKLFI